MTRFHIGKTALAALLVLAVPAAASAQEINGLYGEYFDTGDWTGPVVETRLGEGPIDFFYPKPPATPSTDDPATNGQGGPQGAFFGTKGDNFSAIWRGEIQAPPVPCFLRFQVRSDDLARLYINGVQMVAPNVTTSTSSTLSVTANQRLKVVLMHQEWGGAAYIHLRWAYDAVDTTPDLFEPIPLANLFSPGTVATVAPPTASPNGGVVPLGGSVDVTLNGTPPDPADVITILYTTNGKDPGIIYPSVPFPAGVQTYNGTPITITQYGRIRARSYVTSGPHAGLVSSLFVSDVYSADFPAVAPPAGSEPGLYFRFYDIPGLSSLPIFDNLIPMARGGMNTFGITFPSSNTRPKGDQFGMVVTGYVDIPQSGGWTFYLRSDDGSRLYIDGVEVVNNDGLHGTNPLPGMAGGPITLQAGLHSIRAEMFENGGGESLFVHWSGPSVTNNPPPEIPANRLWRDPIVPAATVTPNGGQFGDSVVVTMSSNETDAFLYWTTDGTPPNPFSPINHQGSGPSPSTITLTRDTVLRVLATAPFKNPSEIKKVNFFRSPLLLSAQTTDVSPREVLVTFDKAVDAASASIAGNYSLAFAGSPGVNVVSAAPVQKTGLGLLRAHWKFDEGVDQAPANDSSLNGNTGVDQPDIFVENDPMTTADDVTYSYYLPGAETSPAFVAPLLGPNPGSRAWFFFDDLIRVDGAASSLKFGFTSFTIAFWMQPFNMTTPRHLINKWDNVNKGWFVSLHDPGEGILRFYMDDGPTGSGALDARIFIDPVDNEWQHVAIRVDRLQARVAIFRNGVLQGTKDMGSNMLSVDNDSPLYIGGKAYPPLGSLETYNGNLDDMRLYGAGLTDGEILGLASGGDQVTTMVRLTTDADLVGAGTLNVQNVKAVGTATVGIPPSGQTIAFAVVTPGSILQESFTGIGGGNITDLTRNGAFPAGSTAIDIRTLFFESTTKGDNYGVRMRGYYSPPSDGTWKFSIASDDYGLFWISPNEDPANKVLVSRVIGWTSSRSYTGEPAVVPPAEFVNGTVTQSVGIPLLATKRYYVEALMKEGGGGDNLAVAAKLNDGTAIADNVPPIDGIRLTPLRDPLVILRHPYSRVTPLAASVSFDAVIGGTGRVTYQWYKDTGSGPVAIAGATGRTFTIASTAATDSAFYSLTVTNPITSQSVTTSPARLIVYNATNPPTLSPVGTPNPNPNSGSAGGGNIVTITGTNFIDGATFVNFGVNRGTVISVDPAGTSLTVSVPSGAVGTVDVRVSTPLGYATLAGAYTYLTAPTVTSVTLGVNGPNSGLATGSYNVIVTGTGFANGVTTDVTFDGVSGTIVSVDSATQMTVTVPPSPRPIGPADVIVYNGPSLNSPTLVDGFSFWNAPTLTQITPNYGPTAGGNQVTITGASLAPNMTVTFTGFGNATIAIQPAGPLYDSMVVNVPAGPAAGGIINVFLTNPNPAITPNSANVPYTYYAAPTITDITANNPPFNGAGGPLAGGTTAVITGTGFVSGQTTVHFTSGAGTIDVVPAPADVTSNQITLTVPAGVAAGAVTVTVETPGGTTPTSVSYTYYAAPTLTVGTIVANVPPFMSANGPLAPTSVTIQGTNFVSSSTNVYFGVTQGTGVVVNLAGTSLTVTTPAGVAPGTGFVNVTIQTPGGTSGADGYTYHDPPVMGTLSPLTGPTNGNIPFSITGAQNFPASLTLIAFGGVSVTDVVATGTGATGTVPQHASGAANVVVTTPGGSTAPTIFTYNAGPFVTNISPAGGPTVVPPPNVTISGSGFVPGATTVTFGALGLGTIQSVTAGQIVVTPPSSPTPTTVNVTIATNGGAETFTVANGYAYVDAPVITNLSITQGPVGGNQQLTITGSGFVPGSTTVTFGGAAATVGTVTSTTIAITTPGHAAGVDLPVIVQTLGQFNSAPSPYTYWGIPTVTSVMPVRGPTNGNQPITITGSNFVDLYTEVTIGGTPATNVAVGPGGTSLTCTTPSHAAGVATITVTTFGPAIPPGQSGSLPNVYTYVDSATSIDLSLTLGVDNATPNVGDDVTLTLGIDNNSAVAGSGISVNMALPAGLTLVSALPSAGSYAGGVWTVGNVGAGGNATLTVVATMTSSATLTVVAEVAAATQPDSDSTPNNGFTFEDDRATVVIDTNLTITTPAALPGTTSGAYYSQPLQASGGSLPLVWSLVSSSPAFPFSLNPATGLLSGTAPTVAVSTPYTFTIQVVDAGSDSTSRAFTLTIDPPATVPGVTVNATPVPADGMVGVAYSHTFTATGATPPYTWSLTGGALPGGLALNTSTGAVAGTPTAAGNFNFTLTATPAAGTPDAQAFSITVNPNPVTWVTPAGALPGGTVGSPYSQLIEVSGGVGSTFTWTLAAGTLPTGINPPSGTTRTATLSGTPTAAGTFNFDLRAADNGQPGLNVVRAFSITIVASGSPTPFSITTTSLPSGTQGQLYTGPGAQLTGMGGTTPYAWSILTGSLPAGLALNAGSGAITGTPTASGSFSITFQGTDAGTGVDTVDLTIDIASIPVVTTTSLPGAVRNNGYFAQLSSTGGTGAIAWTVSAGTLPAGLVLDPTSGAISGTPTPVAGNYAFSVTATDAAGAASTPQPLSIDITDPASGFAISTTSLPSGFAGVPYSFTLQTVGATGPVTWTITNPPFWASFDVNTGTISGIPSAGSFTPSFTAFDGATTPAAGPLTLQIDPALAVATSSLPGSDPGVPYAAQLVASGGVAPETWSILSGTLPPGLAMSTTGAISGITAGTGTYVFTVQVQDGLGRSAQRQLSILVALGASITIDSGSSGKNCSMAAAEPGTSLLPFAALLLLGAFALRKRNLA